MNKNLNQPGPFSLMGPAFMAVIGLCSLISTPVALLLRPQRNWGERVLGFTGIYAVVLLIAVIASAWLWESLVSGEYTATVLLFLLFTVGFSVVGLYQNFQVWQRHRQGDYLSVHSYERGESLGFWYKIPWLQDESTVQRFWEPTLIVTIGILLLPVSQLFGGFLFVQGMALAISEAGMYQIRRNAFLDRCDAIITERVLRRAMDMLEQGEGFDPGYVPAPVKPLFDLKDQGTFKDVASMMLGIEDPKLRQLAQVNGSSGGQHVPPEGATPSGGGLDQADD